MAFQQVFYKLLEFSDKKKRGDYMFRSPTNPSKDEQVFRRTASHMKAVNLGMKIYRGGFRF